MEEDENMMRAGQSGRGKQVCSCRFPPR